MAERKKELSIDELLAMVPEGSDEGSSGELSVDDLLAMAPEEQREDVEPIDDGEYQDLGLLDAIQSGVGKGVDKLGSAASAVGGAIMDPVGTGKAAIDAVGNVVDAVPRVGMAEVAPMALNAISNTSPEEAAQLGENVLRGGGSMAATMGGAALGAKYGAVAGTAIPIPFVGNVVGGAVGAAVGAGAGYVGMDGILSTIDYLVGREPKSFTQSVEEGAEIATLGVAGEAFSRPMRLLKGGNTALQRKALNIADRSANDRNARTQIIRALAKSGTRNVTPKALERAGLISDDITRALSTSKAPVTEANALHRLRDTIKKYNPKTKRFEGGLAAQYGDEVSSYLKGVSKTYKKADAATFLESAKRATVGEVDALANTKVVERKINNAVETAFARKAGYSNKAIQDASSAKVGVAKLTEELSNHSNMPYKDVVRKKAELQTLQAKLKTYNKKVNAAELPADEFWKFTNNTLRSKKLPFDKVQNAEAASAIMMDYRLKLQQDLMKEMGPAKAPSYKLASEKYAAAMDVFDWTEDGIQTLMNAQQGSGGGLIGTSKAAFRDAMRATIAPGGEKLPVIAQHLYNAMDALEGGYRGKPSFYRGLANVLVNTFPKNFGSSIEHTFSASTLGGLRAAEIAVNKYLEEEAPTPFDMELAPAMSSMVDQVLGALTVSKALAESGQGRPEQEQRDLMAQAVNNTSLTPALDIPPAGSGLFQGVRVFDGAPASAKDFDTYLQNLSNSKLNNFKKSELRRYLFENKKFKPEPLEGEQEVKIDNAQIDKRIEMERAREDIRNYRSSLDVVKRGRPWHLIAEQKKKLEASRLEQESFKSDSSSGMTTTSTSLPINWRGYVEALGQRESNNNYEAKNRFGFVGKYQFGLPALVDAGLVKEQYAKKPNSMLKQDYVWKGDLSLEKFFNSPSLQEEAMQKYTERNFRTLKRLKVITDDSTPEEIAGALAAAHLKGPGGARKLILGGKDNVDGFGTRASEYLKLGRNSQKDKGVLV